MLERLDIPAGQDGAVWHYLYRRSAHSPHRHAELELNLVVRGSSHYLLGDRRYDLGPGAAVWLFPQQDHVLLGPSTDFEMWIAVFSPTLLAESGADVAALSAENPPGQFCRFLSDADTMRLADLFDDLSLCQEHGQARRFNAGLKYALLSAWALYESATMAPAHQRVHPAVEQAARLVRKHAADPDPQAAAVRTLARRVGLSEARLSHLFRQQMGMTISRFRANCRLERFFAAWGDGSRSTMLAAATQAGFGSYAQFHRVFRGRMGCGPAELRRRGGASGLGGSSSRRRAGGDRL